MQTNIASTTTYFVGNHYEVTDGVVTKYYYVGSQRIAMRMNGVLYYPLSDHLGSTSITTDSAGSKVFEQRYKPWGETRSSTPNTGAKTQYQFTGQFSYESDFGLYFYNARWYDSTTGRFAQADSIVPAGAQGLDRYAYANNNPVKYTDPSGHCAVNGDNWCVEENGEFTNRVNAITGNNKQLYDAWWTIYRTESGKDLALGLLEKGVQINFVVWKLELA